ncbi:MAG: ABC transporter permease [Thermoplasmata archaeon]|nr:ABC transporter permease [Thermoplasmata archaeon]
MAAPTLFRGLGAFAYTEFYVQAHEYLSIGTSLIVQVVLLIFVRILAPSLLGVALLGAVIFSIFALGQRVQNEAAFIRIDHKLNELYLASPLSPEAYFFGMSVGILAAYTLPVALLVGITIWLVGMTPATAFVLFLAGGAVWLVTSSIGYVVSTLFRDMRTIWPYASLFYNLFGVLPPVFYPIGLLSGGLRTAALLVPSSAAASLVQWSLNTGALAPSEVAIASIALAAEAIGLFLFAIYWARRTVKEG